MINYLTVILSLLGFIFILGCHETDKEADNKNPRMRAGNTPMSELASMMRDMQEVSEEMRAKIIAGDTSDLPRLSFDLQEMKTAEATEPSMKKPPFDAYTDHFDNAFAEIYNSELSKKTAYNNMIESCLTCHQSFCSGPIKAINKLKIEEQTLSINN